MGGSKKDSRAVRLLQDHNTSPERDVSEGDKSKRVRKTSSHSNQKEKTTASHKEKKKVAGNAEGDGRTGSSDRRTSSTSRRKDGNRSRSWRASDDPHNGHDGGKEDRNERKSSGSPDKRAPSSKTWRKDGDHRSMSANGSHTRGRKQSRSKSSEKQEPMHGEGKPDSGSKKALPSKHHVSRSKSSSSGTSTPSHARRLKKKRRLSTLSDDDSDQPSWTKTKKFRNLFQCQQLNEERLERIESAIRRANALDEKQRLISSKSAHKLINKSMRIKFSLINLLLLICIKPCIPVMLFKKSSRSMRV